MTTSVGVGPESAARIFGAPARYLVLRLAVSLLTAGLAAPGQAVDIRYSDILLDTWVRAYDPFTEPLEHAPPSVLVAPGNPDPHQALLEPGWRRAPMSTSTLSAGFASAAMSAEGIGGVGVSGFRRGGPHGSADAISGQDITNLSGSTQYVFLEWHIPVIEVSMADTDSFDAVIPSGYPRARASARMAYTLVDGSGNVVESRDFFDYTVELIKDTRNMDDILFLRVSPDLEFRTNALCDIGECVNELIRETVGPHEVAGMRWSAFSASYDGFALPPDHTLAINYLLSASAYGGDPAIVDDIDLSIQALIGDPFDLSVSGAAFTIEVRSTLAVPEPGGAWLLSAGLMVMVLMLRRARGTGWEVCPRMVPILGR